MKVSKQPQNTQGIFCYYNKSHFVLQQRSQNHKQKIQQFLVINRQTQQLALSKTYDLSNFEKKSFSAFLGIINFDGYRFILFCDEAKVVSTIDTLEIFQISSLFFLGYIDQRALKQRPQRKQIYRKIREYYIILKTGFYFSYKYNLTQSFQNQKCKKIAERFAWNRKLLEQIDYFNLPFHWKCPIIQGFAKSFEVFLEGTKLCYVLISRRSNKKGGTRYFDRGLNDEGFVANFVQTEQIIKLDDFFISDLQIRGSIPIFFEQVGLTTRTKLSRGYQLTHQIYKKHMNKLLNQYMRVFFVNLLSVGKGGQKMLIEQLQKHIKSQNEQNLKYLYYDFHHKVNGGHYQMVDEIINEIKKYKVNLKYFIYDSKKQNVMERQYGVFRTNCLDCLDRTNFFQAKLALITLEVILKQFNVCNKNLLEEMTNNKQDNDFIRKFRNIWADNGDAISYHYTGTGSTHTDITRDGKRGWLGNFKHKYKTVARFYNQNFWDFYKMKLVGLLLDQNRYNDKMTKQIKEREEEYCKKQQVQIYIFTWKAPKKAPHSLMLFPNTPQIIAISIQQTGEHEKWGRIIRQAVQEKYMLVNQKIANNNILKIFALKTLKNRISLVETAKVKFKSYYNTVLSNKGANIVRFNFDNTKLTFIGCQLEYGRQFMDNRMKNLKDIHQFAYQLEEVGVQKSSNILADDVIFLFGNLNMNVSSIFKTQFQKFNQISNVGQTSQKLISKMLETDESNQIRQSLLQYRQYQEEQIKFIPTYKYSNNVFDPEKSGWPDRIWYSCQSKINCKRYDVIQQMRNEHVPVVGTYLVEIEKIDEQLKESIYTQIFERENNQQLKEIEENELEYNQSQNYIRL